MRKPRFWAEMTSADFGRDEMARTIAVLPVAATEQHGPHLPLGTDTMIMEGYIAKVIARLPEELAVLFLPVQNCGLSIEHTDFSGTLSLSSTLIIRSWTEICECVHKAGCRKLVLLSSHGGNSAVLETIAHYLRARLNMLAVVASWRRLGAPDGLSSAHEQAHGNHAGEFETSLMLAFRPDLVRIERAADFPSASADIEREFNWLRPGRPAGFGWMARSFRLRRDGQCGGRERAKGRGLGGLWRNGLHRAVGRNRPFRSYAVQGRSASLKFRAWMRGPSGRT